MRVTTAFNRVLDLPGTQVESVSFTDDGIVLGVRRQARRHRCPCGWSTRARYDCSRRRWRHLDLAGHRCWLEADIARISCRSCGRVRTEDVAWARPGARCTREVENQIAWLAQRMDKSAVAQLLRVAWRTVDAAVQRLVDDHQGPEAVSARLDGLTRLGVDEISYKRGHSYLTVVADHDTGTVVWVAKTRSAKAFEDFAELLGPERCARITSVTMDLGHIYRGAVERTMPDAQICFDPFHVIQWANEALERVLASTRAALSAELMPEGLVTGLAGPQPDAPPPGSETREDGIRRRNAARSVNGKIWRKARFLLRAGAERLTDDNREVLDRLREQDLTLARAWELKEGLRGLYQNLDPEAVRGYLEAWCQSATLSAVPAFVTLARRIRKNFDGIAAAVESGLSNSRLEGINAKIRVIQRRGYGHPNPDSLIAMIHLCLGGIRPLLPTRT